MTLRTCSAPNLEMEEENFSEISLATYQAVQIVFHYLHPKDGASKLLHRSTWRHILEKLNHQHRSENLKFHFVNFLIDYPNLKYSEQNSTK
jgi:hypothetical protein